MASVWQTGILHRFPHNETQIFALIVPDDDSGPKVINLRDGSKGHALRQITTDYRASFIVGKGQDETGESKIFSGAKSFLDFPYEVGDSTSRNNF